MNNVTLTGNLTRDPHLKHVEERAICELRVAVDNGAHPTTYVDVTTFDGQAHACAEFLAKGRKVGVSGRLVLDEWEAADGSRRSRHFVIGRVEFLDQPRRAEQGDVPTPDPDGGFMADVTG
jgi:single-strand DNA-binding protein